MQLEKMGDPALQQNQIGNQSQLRGAARFAALPKKGRAKSSQEQAHSHAFYMTLFQQFEQARAPAETSAVVSWQPRDKVAWTFLYNPNQ